MPHASRPDADLDTLAEQVGARLGRRSCLGRGSRERLGSTALLAGEAQAAPAATQRRPRAPARHREDPRALRPSASRRGLLGQAAQPHQHAGGRRLLRIGGHHRHHLPRGGARGPGQGPAAYFESFGVPEREVLTDAVAVAARATHDGPGPHVVTGPIAVRGPSRATCSRSRCSTCPCGAVRRDLQPARQGSAAGRVSRAVRGQARARPLLQRRAATSASSPRWRSGSTGCEGGSRAR